MNAKQVVGRVLCGVMVFLFAGCGPGAERCGAGTSLVDNECVPTSTPATCGPGTTLQGTQCLVDPDAGTYVLRVPVASVDGDGYSKIPVFSLGTLPSGLPSNEAVVLTVTPSYLGTVSPATFTLGSLGSTSYFTPCVGTSPACHGDFELQLALASNPSLPVATTGTMTIAPPTGVSSAASCLGTSSVMFFDGDTGDWVYQGSETVTQGAWSAQGSDRAVTVHVTPSDSKQGLWWDLEFSTQQLDQTLGVNVYKNAERAPFASPGHPGIDIGGDGRGCNTISGSFQVHTITWADTSLTEFLASFEQHCEGGAPALRGCVHYVR